MIGWVGVFDFGQCCVQCSIVGGFGQCVYFGYVYVGEEVDYLWIIDGYVMGIVDGFIEVVEFGMEVLEFWCGGDFFQVFVIGYVFVVGVQECIICIEVSVDCFQIYDVVCCIFEVFVEWIWWYILMGDGCEFVWCQFERQCIDLVY